MNAMNPTNPPRNTIPIRMVTTPSTRWMARLWSLIAEPRLPNSTPCSTKIALNPATNSNAPATIRRWLGFSSLPDRPAT